MIADNKDSVIQNENRPKEEKQEATEKEFLVLRIVFSLAPIQIEKYIRRIFFTLLASA